MPVTKLLGAALALAVCAAPLGAAGGPDIPADVSRAVERYETVSTAIVGLSAVDLRTGRRLLARRDDRAFIPASNAKLLTTAFALIRLGAADGFTTAVYRVGDDLVVFGNGDPTLGDPVIAERRGADIYADLDAWARAALKQTGGSCRNVIACGLADTDSYRHADWPEAQHNRWYAAPAAGLNFHNNCFDITFRVHGRVARPIVSPVSRHIRVVDKVRRGRSHLWSARSSEDGSVLTVAGTARRSTDEPISVAVDDPPLLLARVFADRLERAGVKVLGDVATAPPGEIDWSAAVPVAATAAPLDVVLARCNRDSLNLAAECLLLRAGDGTWDGSAALAERTLAAEFRLPPGSLTIRDGSGLSKTNRVTPAALTTLLAAMRLRGDGGTFIDSLAVAGVSGTLDDRLRRDDYRGRVRAKTGYVAGVSALSGYVLDADGEPAVAFSVLINRMPGGGLGAARKLQDDVVRTLVDWVDAD